MYIYIYMCMHVLSGATSWLYASVSLPPLLHECICVPDQQAAAVHDTACVSYITCVTEHTTLLC